jgi:hypothetical protein
MMTRNSLALLSALLMGTAACDMPATFEPGPDARRHVGIVEWSRSDVQTFADPALGVITAPDTVTAGQPFQVTVTTVGPNSCWRVASTELASQPSVATITPFDRVIDGICAQALVSLQHTAQVRFDVRGEATIRAYGRRVVDGNLNAATDRTVEKKVIVR